MTAPEMDGDQTLHSSLHYLRGEYEGIRQIRRTRRKDMPQAQVKMNVTSDESHHTIEVVMHLEGDDDAH